MWKLLLFPLRVRIWCINLLEDGLVKRVSCIYGGDRDSCLSAGYYKRQSASRCWSAIRHVRLTVLILTLISLAEGQRPILTSLADNARTAANTDETLLSPSNVNKNNFGHLFSQPIDYVAQAQPLYVPNVNIPGKGVHNVVYVVTMKDTVYVFDAEGNAGNNALPLWQVNFTDPVHGITTASGGNLPCGSEGGFIEEGIVSTPAIDVAGSTMYLVAKTVDNGTVVHRLHALDLATGQEKLGGPVALAATSVSNAGHRTVFNSLHQKNRPGLLLMNGTGSMGFGSNGCNDGNTGWVLAYDATTLQQTGVFNTNPDHGHTSIWQAGGGLAADDFGNLYPLTSEGKFDVDIGGQGYTDSVLKLSGGSLDLTDYFIPANVVFINNNDMDLSACSPVVLPDQDGPFPHVLIATGKQGVIYVLNRDNLGLFGVSDSQIIQELQGVIGNMRGAPAYWNGRVYFSAKADFLKAFSVSGGMLSTPPVAQTTAKLTGAHSPAVSANGNTNGIIWVINGGGLYAYDAMTLAMLYNSKLVVGDALPPVGHFATQTVANGRVYIATQNSLEAYGLKHYLSLTTGGGQTGVVKTTLQPIQVQALQGYANLPYVGATITFSDGGKGGVFNPPSAVTDNNGIANTTYTLPKKAGTYTLAISASGFGSLTTTATALPGPPVLIVSGGGNKQIGPAGSVLPIPLAAKVRDAYANGVPGITITFDDAGKGGLLNPAVATTGADGKARTNYQLPATLGTYKVNASGSGLKTFKFTETAQ